MFQFKIRASTSFIGTTGYNNHAQSFFKALSNYCSLQIRNFTIGKTWNQYSDEPHNAEPYMDDQYKNLLTEQTLWNDKHELVDLPIYQNYTNLGKYQINLVLNETNHYYFYQSYSGYKIAFNVWESTLQPEDFFKKLLEFHELWVPSKWQRDCTIKQGYPEDKIFVIPEGVDTATFYSGKAYHSLTSNPKRFTFGLFGRWDYRKSTKEIIETFLKTFDKKEPVDLIVSIDNPYSGDKMKSTEERLKYYGLLDDRIKILHFPPREDYVALMKSMNVFVSCSRAEGWNLPLIESMACGTPSIYSDCCAQLEFAEGRGLPVKILGEKPANTSSYNHFNEMIGNYYEPDFEDLRKVMRNAYEKYADHKERALKEAKEIHELYNWDTVAKLAADHLESRKDFITNVLQNDPNRLKVSYHFISGPHLEITGGDPGTFRVQFINNDTGKIEHEEVIKNNMWVSAAKQYYVNWKVKLTDARTGEVFIDKDIDLKDQRVYVSLDSSSLGDTLSWFPPIEEFRKKHDCKMVCSTFHNEWFKDNYPEIEFVTPGTIVNNLTAMYTLGWFYMDPKVGDIDYAKNPTNPRPMPLQKSQFDILGLEYQEIKPKINIPNVKKKKQVAIAIHATCQAKYWNKVRGWQDVVDWCKLNGYEVVLLSKEDDGFMGNYHPTGIRKHPAGPIEDVIKELAASQAFVGVGSGLSWLSWALNVPTVIISGFSYPYTETQKNTYRVITPSGKCTGCFNRHRLLTDDWLWCPDNKGTERTFECTRSITPKMVIEQLKLALDNG